MFRDEVVDPPIGGHSSQLQLTVPEIGSAFVAVDRLSLFVERFGRQEALEGQGAARRTGAGLELDPGARARARLISPGPARLPAPGRRSKS